MKNSSNKKYNIHAWYFPNWHVDKFNEKWHGKGWTEWEVVKCARSRFEGHNQPNVPLWGYEDEADPKVFEKKIKYAVDAGIDGFIFDFYWYKPLGQYRIRALEEGFLKASNNTDMEFSVMWCNHDPSCAHPETFYHGDLTLCDGRADEAFFVEMTDYIIKNYFPKPNYRRVNGKCYFGIWQMSRFVREMGSIENAGRILNEFRARAEKAGFPVHLSCNVNGAPYFQNVNSPDPLIPGVPANAELCKKTADILGVNSLFNYGWALPECTEWPKVEYEAYREKNYNLMKERVKFSPLPIDFAVSLGWDSSPRTCPSDMYNRPQPGESYHFSYFPIVVGNTPEQIEKSFRLFKEYADSDEYKGDALLISTWNEWTEGNYMEPDQKNGYGFLEACKRVFKDNK